MYLRLLILLIVLIIIAVIIVIIIKVKKSPKREKKEASASRSYFDGGFWHLIGLNIGGFLVCLITLGIAFPWVCCWILRWRINHTVVEGKRLQFNGSGGALFGHFILKGWLLGLILTPLTLGLYPIYYFNVSLKKWEVKNTSFSA